MLSCFPKEFASFECIFFSSCKSRRANSPKWPISFLILNMAKVPCSKMHLFNRCIYIIQYRTLLKPDRCQVVRGFSKKNFLISKLTKPLQQINFNGPKFVHEGKKMSANWKQDKFLMTKKKNICFYFTLMSGFTAFETNILWVCIFLCTIFPTPLWWS